jgi:hypothetical protein
VSTAPERFWANRLRWRFRGAWQWPAFAVLTVADAAILHLLPPVGTGIDPFLALILASFGNLVLVGAAAPWIAARLVERQQRERTPGAPAEVVLDRTATALLAVGAVGLVVAGLGSRPLVVSETKATEENARLVESYVARHGSDEVKRNLGSANTRRLSEGYFRTCVALDDKRRAFCMFVDTKRNTVKPDRDARPNALVFGTER